MIQLTSKEKDTLLGVIMKSLPAARRFDSVSIRKNDFNKFHHSFYNWEILLHVNRLVLVNQKCLEGKRAERIRPLQNKGLDRVCG